MKKTELLLIIEEIEMKILRLRISLKKVERDIVALNNFYNLKKRASIAPFVQTELKKRNLMQSDVQIMIAEMLQSKFYFQQLLKNN